MPPRIAVRDIAYFERPVGFVRPFRFGAVVVNAAPQVFVRVEIEIEGQGNGKATSTGASAEMMVPKWFDKRPQLSPEQTVGRTVALLSAKGSLERLLKVADSEPPRVRAILGAIGEQLGHHPASLRRLRASLNPFSRFDFGLFAGLTHARKWQAKERHSR